MEVRKGGGGGRDTKKCGFLKFLSCKEEWLKGNLPWPWDPWGWWAHCCRSWSAPAAPPLSCPPIPGSWDSYSYMFTFRNGMCIHKFSLHFFSFLCSYTCRLEHIVHLFKCLPSPSLKSCTFLDFCFYLAKYSIDCFIPLYLHGKLFPLSFGPPLCLTSLSPGPLLCLTSLSRGPLLCLTSLSPGPLLCLTSLSRGPLLCLTSLSPGPLPRSLRPSCWGAWLLPPIEPSPPAGTCTPPWIKKNNFFYFINTFYVLCLIEMYALFRLTSWCILW